MKLLLDTGTSKTIIKPDKSSKAHTHVKTRSRQVTVSSQASIPLFPELNSERSLEFILYDFHEFFDFTQFNVTEENNDDINMQVQYDEKLKLPLFDKNELNNLFPPGEPPDNQTVHTSHDNPYVQYLIQNNPLTI